MKKIVISMVTLALCGGVAFSQGHIDAHKYAQSELNGTARYLGMGGAFGALGGDISAMKTNPAGLAVYRSSEVVTTLSVNGVSAKSNWLGIEEKHNQSNVSFDNIAYVGYFPTGNTTGLVSWNAGFAYNRVKNFKRRYSMSSGGDANGFNLSISDYLVNRANGIPASALYQTDSYDPYARVDDWLSVLGYNGGFINEFEGNTSSYYSNFGETDANGDWYEYNMFDHYLEVWESGSIDEYDISFGLNFSDIVLVGATLALTDITYNQDVVYDELFEYEGNDLFIDNGLSTDGTGYSFNVGVIVRPSDYFRLGVAYNSPTWYNMTDYYYGSAGAAFNYMDGDELIQENHSANTPNNAHTDYKYKSPDKWLFSAAAILGQYGLISVDYELKNYKNMGTYFRNGDENTVTNGEIDAYYKTSNTIRIGGEFKPTPQFSVRAGGGWSSTPMTKELLDNNTEVMTVGTIANYTLDRGSSYYSLGLGYRFTPNFYTDLAYVYTTYKEDVYPFSNIGDMAVTPATMKTNTTKVALTLGYKF